MIDRIVKGGAESRFGTRYLGHQKGHQNYVIINNRIRFGQGTHPDPLQKDSVITSRAKRRDTYAISCCKFHGADGFLGGYIGMTHQAKQFSIIVGSIPQCTTLVSWMGKFLCNIANQVR